jgi:hypothetical protein
MMTEMGLSWVNVVFAVVMSFVTTASTLIAWKHYQEKEIHELKLSQASLSMRFDEYQKLTSAEITRRVERLEDNLNKRFDRLEERMQRVIDAKS